MRQSGLDYRAIGQRIRQRRTEMSMTQEALAEKVGISTSFVGHIERGEKIASIDTIVRICDALGSNLDYVILGIQNDCNKTKCDLYENISALLKRYGINKA